MIEDHALVLDQAERQEIEECYRTGKVKYHPIKLRLIELIVSRFATAKQKRAELRAHPEYVRKVLDQGADKARTVAREMLQCVRMAVGLC